MIDYQELFRQDFDPRISLLNKIKEKIPNLENRIHLDDQLNKFAKDDVFDIISGNYKQKTDLRSSIPSFMPNTYFELLSCFQFDNTDTKESLKNSIVDATYEDLISHSFLDEFSKQNIDLVGLYLFISKKGFVICSINCAQSFSNDDPFSPEIFLKALKESGNLSPDLSIDEELQKITEEYAHKFENFDRNARKDFKSLFQDKYKYNSAYNRFTVPSDQNKQIINTVLSNPSLNSIFKPKFDKIGFSLFHVYNQIQLLVIVSNSHADQAKKSELLDQLCDEDSGGALFDDDNDDDEVDNSINESKEKSKNKESSVINKVQKSNKNDEFDYDTTDSALLNYDKSKDNPIPHNHISQYSSNLDFSSLDDTDDDDRNLSNLPQFNSPLALSLNKPKPNNKDEENDYSSQIISTQSMMSNKTDKKDDESDDYNDNEDNDEIFELSDKNKNSGILDLSKFKGSAHLTPSLSVSPTKIGSVTVNQIHIPLRPAFSPDPTKLKANENEKEESKSAIIDDDDDDEFSDLLQLRSPQKPVSEMASTKTPLLSLNSPTKSENPASLFKPQCFSFDFNSYKADDDDNFGDTPKNKTLSPPLLSLNAPNSNSQSNDKKPAPILKLNAGNDNDDNEDIPHNKTSSPPLLSLNAPNSNSQSNDKKPAPILKLNAGNDILKGDDDDDEDIF